jgi:4-amino-4-deoxy-L-arabinose transferase-like glycosyltransferase
VSTLSAPINPPARLKVAGRDLLVVSGFLALSLALRLGSFGRSVIDLDESFFLMLGRSLLRGEIPYTTIFEHSPMGGFALFAGIQVVFGQSVLAIRIAAWLGVGLASYLVYRLAKRIAGGTEIAGLLAGLLYIVFTLYNLGLAAHREIFLAPLVAFAALMLIPERGRPGSWRILAAGIAMGCALQLKYMYVFEAAAVALMATAQILWDERRPARAMVLELMRAYALLAAPAVLIVGGEAAYFALAGHWQEFVIANFGSAAAYVENQPYSLAYLGRRLTWQTRTYTLVWLGAVLAPFYLLARPDRVQRIRVACIVAWFVFALAGTMSTGRYWDHYYLQLVAPGSILTAVVLAGLLSAAPAGFRGYKAFVLLFALAPLYTLVYPPALASVGLLKDAARGQMPPADGPVLVSDYLKARLRPGEAVWVADYEPLVYYLVDPVVPTRYSFPMHLTNLDFGRLGIQQMAEFRRIMDTRPAYVVLQSPPSDDMTFPALKAELATRLATDYVLEKEIAANESFSGKPIAVQIYRLK